MSGFRLLSLAATLATYGVIVMGGVVRVSGSGLGCPDWPLCNGQIIPPLEGPTLIEYSHRLLTMVATLLIVMVTAVAWRTYRQNKVILLSTTAASILLAVQILLGGVTVLLELPPTIVTAHLATAMAILAALVVTTTYVFVYPPKQALGRVDWSASGLKTFPTWALIAALATYGLMLTGAYVVGSGASLACPDWPLCNGQILPKGGRLAEIHFLHRAIVLLVAALIVVMAVKGWRHGFQRGPSSVLTLVATLALALYGVQMLIGAANIWTSLSPLATASHLAVGAAVWATVVALTVLSYLLSQPERVTESAAGGPPSDWRKVVTDYLALTKPHIIWLLLVTTIPAMVVAAKGIPPIGLMLATLVGGALAAGGANAINCYLDKDIDKVMARTRRRPLPDGRVDPEKALAFGILLGYLSFFELVVLVNLLSAALALSAMLFYVFAYTVWLKRTTPQNIVIGGAAGAVPPLVGWAAVTGSVELPALILFAIIFYWTPPHFWALAISNSSDYERARIPMLPVVRGEKETKRQIVLYSLLLLVVTLLLFPTGAVGFFYLIAALVLGTLFLAGAIRLLRDATRHTALRLFKFSTTYLALLFGTMVVDQLVRIL